MKHLTRPGKGGRSHPSEQLPTAIRVARCYGASSKQVFNAWLDPEIAGRWLFATATRPMTYVEINARVEGSFCFAEQRRGESVRHTGEYIEIVPHRRLVFTLHMDHPHAVTRVTVEIAGLKAGCELALTHEGVPMLCASQTEERWTGILYGLGVTLSTRDRYRRNQ